MVQDQFQVQLNKLTETYGSELLKGMPHRVAALMMMSATMQKIPRDATLDEETKFLRNLGYFVDKPILNETLNEFQDKFIKNRYAEIIFDNADNPMLSKKNSFDEKIVACEAAGLISIQMQSDRKTLTGGHTLQDFVGDLYELYLIEYQLFKQDPNHYIFKIRRVDELNSSANPSQVSSSNESKTIPTNRGCLGLVSLAILILILSIYFF